METMERKTLNMILWPVALLLLNSIWFGVSDNSAPYEINDYDHPIEDRTLTLGGVFGQDKPMPAKFDVEFKSSSTEVGAVGWKIFDQNSILIAEWSGDVSDENTGWEGELIPGTYRIETTVSQDISTEQTLFIQPFGSYSLEGHVALSFLLVMVAFAETFLRIKGAEYLEKKSTHASTIRETAPFTRRGRSMPEHDMPHPEYDPWRTPKGL
tara:strand:+ start:6585 stop:7217 length:633 start_codon:yes stop_codon:yes gene_type:complete